jgi:protein gp37
MGLHTNISWTDITWNPWQGCHHVSPGCANCYMFREKIRYGKDPNTVVRSKPPTFNMPLKIERSQKVFTCSWSDWFIKEADDWRDDAWEIIRRTPHLTYQILTKRIERADGRLPWGDGEPWKNVWLMVSAENQETFDRRVPILLDTNAAVRGVSMEPLLGDIVMPHKWMLPSFAKDDYRYHRPGGRGLDWVIVGGESGGPPERRCAVEWIDRVVCQCQAAGVACWVKQDAGPSSEQQGRLSNELFAIKEFPTC